MIGKFGLRSTEREGGYHYVMECTPVSYGRRPSWSEYSGRKDRCRTPALVLAGQYVARLPLFRIMFLMTAIVTDVLVRFGL